MNDGSVSVGMFTNLFRPVVSGSSTHSATLAGELARLGHRPFVITARLDETSPSYEEDAGVAIYRLPCLRMPKMPISLNFPWLNVTCIPGNRRRIERIIHRHRPDVLHLHNHMFDMAFHAVAMSRRWRLPLAITIHTMIRHTKALYNTLLYPADRLLLRCLVANRADVLICPDINIQQYARQAFASTPTRLVPYGVSFTPPPAREHVERLRARFGLAGKRVILSLGHIHEVRCRRDEVRAMPAILRAVPNAVLLLVGAETTDIPRRLAAELGVVDSVLFAGQAPHWDVPAYLALADLEVHLFYQDDEERTSLGIASLEAMASGKVVLSAAGKDTYGPGLLRDGENVFLMRRGQPDRLARIIVELLNDEPRRRRIGEAAERFVRGHFGWDSVCRRTLQVYQDICSRPSRAQGR
jgi:glycosyltransferase involved in cell wall biosynthesis